MLFFFAKMRVFYMLFSMNNHLNSLREILFSIEAQVGETIIGQNNLIRKIVIALFAG
jgi:hypothetical protein